MHQRKATFTFIAVTLGAVAAGWSWAAWAATLTVAQHGRAFQPNEIQLNAGDVADFVNDDRDLLHHAYLKTPGFSFDTGEQEPGTTAHVRFTTPGTFTVLCGIHPKMRLSVVVR